MESTRPGCGSAGHRYLPTDLLLLLLLFDILFVNPVFNGSDATGTILRGDGQRHPPRRNVARENWKTGKLQPKKEESEPLCAASTEPHITGFTVLIAIM